MKSKIVVLSICILLASCMSQIASHKDFTTSWVGAPISRYLEARAAPSVSRKNFPGNEQVTQLGNGNQLYEFPSRKCPYFFEVDTSGIIVRVYSEGDKQCY